MLLFAVTIILLASTLHGQNVYQLNIRDNGKLCTQPISAVNGQISIQFIPNPECAGNVTLDWVGSSQARACCPALPPTTTSSIFPRECGKQQYEPSKERIVGGAHARPNSWPWQIRLHANGGLCGGTLIDTRHVLTAAHCFQTPIVLQNHQVYIGLHDIGQPVYGEQVIAAEKIFLHEQYNSNTQEHDIAIIRLAKPITISDKVNVICLPGPEANNHNTTVWVAGWGTTSWQGQTSPVLKQTSLVTMPTRCPQIYNRYDDKRQICAGVHGGGRDTCQGDSGGPLMYESNGQWFLNGVVSYGFECARDEFPGVYTRVSFYLPWVLGKLREL